MTPDTSLVVKCPVCGRAVQYANHGPGMYMLKEHTTIGVAADDRIAVLMDFMNTGARCSGSGCLGFSCLLSQEKLGNEGQHRSA